MSKTFTKIINITFISFFLMSAFSSIKLSNKKALSGKKSIDIEHTINNKAPVKINNFLQQSLSPNATLFSIGESQQKPMNNQFQQDITSAKKLMNFKKIAEKKINQEENSSKNGNNNLSNQNGNNNENNNNNQSNNNQNRNKIKDLVNKIENNSNNNNNQSNNNQNRNKIKDFVNKIENNRNNNQNNNQNNNFNNNYNNNNQNRINQSNQQENKRKQEVHSLEKSAIIDKINKKNELNTFTKGSEVKHINKFDVKEILTKDEFINKINKFDVKTEFEKAGIKDVFNKEIKLSENEIIRRIVNEKTQKIIEKNEMIEDIIKEKNNKITGAPILEIGIKQRGSRSMNKADSSLKKEISSHLEKEIAEDTLRKTLQAEIMLNKSSKNLMKNCGDELKRQISTDVLKNIEHKFIKDKARAAEILERITTTNIREKEMVVGVLKKVAKALKEEYSKNIDPEKVLDETTITSIFNSGAEKIKEMIENKKEISIAKEILKKAEKVDLEGKKNASGSIDRAIEDMKKTSRELKREIEKKEILEVLEVVKYVEDTNNTTNKEGNSNNNEIRAKIVKHIVEDKNKKVSKDAEPIGVSEVSKDAEPIGVSEDSETIEVSKDAEPEEVSKDAEPEEVSKDAEPMKVSKYINPIKVSKYTLKQKLKDIEVSYISGDKNKKAKMIEIIKLDDLKKMKDLKRDINIPKVMAKKKFNLRKH